MKNIFCANEQKLTPHKATVDANGEYVFTCACGRFLKLPADTKDFEKVFAVHEKANTGQVSIEAQEKKLAELMEEVEPEVEPEVEEEEGE